MEWRRDEPTSVQGADLAEASLGAHARAVVGHWAPLLILVAVLVGGLVATFGALGYPTLAVPVGAYFLGMLVVLAIVELRRFLGAAAHRRTRTALAIGRALAAAEAKGFVVRSHLPHGDLGDDHLLIGDDRVVLIAGVTVHGEWEITSGGIPLPAGDPVPAVRARAGVAKRLVAGGDASIAVDSWLVVQGTGRGRATPAQIRDLLVLRPRDLERAVAELPEVADLERRDGWTLRADAFVERTSIATP